MSVLTVSYGSLKDASNESKAVARKLNGYADSIEKTVYNKLNKYSGEWTNSIYTARNNANSKISALRSQAERYNTYASDLIDLRDECKRVDKAVRSTVSSLTASFKEAHGIRNSKVENAISYFFTSLGNSSSFGRWLGDKADMFRTGSNYLKDSIKEWYNYEGGKDLIKGVLIGLLEVAIGVLSIVATILTGGTFLVILAGVVAGVIAVANGIANIVNEGRAYNSTQNDDPATGKRLSAENTIQDFLRDGDITDETGGGLFGVNNHVNLARNIATGIDITNLCCTVITVVSSAGKLLKNGYKWATGSSKSFADIKIKDLFSKDFFKGIGTKIKTGFTDIKATLKFKDWSMAKDFGTRIFSDFKFNLSKRFANFTSVKDGIKTTKNYLSISKDLFKDGLTFSNIFNVGVENVVIPCITVFTVTKDTPGINSIGQGQISFDFFDHVTVDEFYGIGDKINSKIINSPVFDSDNIINSEIMSKLSSSCNINVSIPEIKVPEISVNLAA